MEYVFWGFPIYYDVSMAMKVICSIHDLLSSISVSVSVVSVSQYLLLAHSTWRDLLINDPKATKHSCVMLTILSANLIPFLL